MTGTLFFSWLPRNHSHFVTIVNWCN